MLKTWKWMGKKMNDLEINFQLWPKLLGILENDLELCPITRLHTVAALQLSSPEVLTEIIASTERKLETQLLTFFKRIKVEFVFSNKLLCVCMCVQVYMYFVCVYIYIHVYTYVYVYLYMYINCASLLSTLTAKT